MASAWGPQRPFRASAMAVPLSLSVFTVDQAEQHNDNVSRWTSVVGAVS